MARSSWKGPFLDKFLFKNIENKKIWSRRSTIPLNLVGKTLSVYNGKQFKLLTITRDRVGFKFGTFVSTRNHTTKQSNSNKAKKK